jgi:MoxR-like ATPase
MSDTSPSLPPSESALAVRAAIARAREGLVERDVLVELVAMAAIAGEHLLVVGPPGTAKSEAVRRIAQALGGNFFEYLLGRFTEPSEIFGPVDLRALRDGKVETQTAGMLPEADIAFLDELFLGSTAILNTLLALLNERVFRRGHTNLRVPLRVCVGASNHLPDDESLVAFADRFLVRVFVSPVPDPQLEALLEASWKSAQQPGEGAIASLGSLDALAHAAKLADMTGVRGQLAHAVRRLRSAGVVLTDRRVGKAQSLIAAAAVLAGRTAPTSADLWPIVYVVPTLDQQRVARETLRDLLASAENTTLIHAAEEASAGPAARASRILAAGDALFASGVPANEDATGGAWRLQLEGVAREIDAGFAPETMPEGLKAMRARIVVALADAGSEA